MSTLWDPVIEGSNPRWEDALAHHYGDPRAEADAVGHADVMAALTHLGAIALRGGDARMLLQGQLTTDIDLLGPRHTLAGAWCSPKGRVLTIVRVLERDDGVVLQLPREYVESTITRMRMYVLRADVKLVDVSDQVLALGVAGPGIVRLLEGALGEVPQEVDDAVHAGGCTVVRLRGSPPRFTILGTAERLRALWVQWLVAVRPVGSSAWRLGDIRAGVPELSGALTDTFLPQMLNLQALGAVSFTKGCYTGQEIVARTQHLGRLKRRLYLAGVSADKAPRPGDALYRTDSGVPSAIGTVVSVASNGPCHSELLAVIQIEAAENANSSLDPGSDHRALVLHALPYEIDAP